MELDVDKLIKILDKQNSLIEELRALTSVQLQALKQNDLTEIININSQQEYVGRQLAVLEQQRRVIIEKVSLDNGIDIKHFSDLVSHTTRDEFAEIEKKRNVIIAACQKLREEQRLNALLLKQGLRYAERILGIINPKRSLVYDKTGDLKRAESIGRLDANV
ncbi:MAG: flagellar protein FlgN [Syntrophomonadaceae bacterium]|nr:flagellar protein FlgN [Syntrophomonadaceae bacterium]